MRIKYWLLVIFSYTAAIPAYGIALLLFSTYMYMMWYMPLSQRTVFPNPIGAINDNIIFISLTIDFVVINWKLFFAEIVLFPLHLLTLAMSETFSSSQIETGVMK